jgi:archaellum biogenesis ATPase FlaH
MTSIISPLNKYSQHNTYLTQMDFFKLVAEVGFPIAAALAAGYFVFLTLKFILAGVTGSVKSLSGIISALNNRVKTMNHDVIRIDTLMSSALGVKPDVDRIARADGKDDARKD